MSVVGIDLGTTNTVVACVRSGKVHVLADEHGIRLLPSVVSFHPNGEVLVGAAAKARRVIDPRNTVYSHKRLIGRSWGSPEIAQAKSRFAFELKEGPGQGPLVRARGQDYTLPEISAFVLKRARQIAETALGASVERAVITVPAHFNELQRASTKVAGRVSGLEVLRILNEPTAAALAYGLGRSGNERVAVYDFGGGTFDCTLLDLNGNVFEVLATAGDSFLGGDDVDNMIAERMAETYLKAHRYDPRTDAQMLERLKTCAEDIKMVLSTAETHTVVLKEFGHGAGGSSINFTFTMTRRDLEHMITPLIERSFKVTQDALSLARLSPTSFDKIILVGGSTRIPLVRKRVESFFGQAPLDRVNPDEVVAIGAAIQAAALTEGARRRSIPAAPPVIGKPKTLQGLQRDQDENTQTSQIDADKLVDPAPGPAFGSSPPAFGFHPASSPPPTTKSNPPGVAGAVRRSDVPGPKKPTNPGMQPVTQPMGARSPSAPPAPGQQGAFEEDPSIASFPDLAVPTPFEWFPSGQPSSGGAPAPSGPTGSERSFGGNTLTANSPAEPNTMTAAIPQPGQPPGPPQHPAFVTGPHRPPQAPGSQPGQPPGPPQHPAFMTGPPAPRSSVGAPAGFGAIDEPPSLYSTPSASVPSFPSMASGGGTAMPSPLGDGPFGTGSQPDAETSPRTAMPNLDSGRGDLPSGGAFGEIREMSLVSTSGVSTSGVSGSAVTQGAPGLPSSDQPFGHLPDLSLVSTSSATAELDDVTEARQKMQAELEGETAVKKGGTVNLDPAANPGARGPAPIAPPIDEGADLPAVAERADLPAVRGGKPSGPSRKPVSPGMSASGGSSMVGKPPPIVAPQPFGPMEKIGEESPPSRTAAMQGRPPPAAPSSSPVKGGAAKTQLQVQAKGGQPAPQAQKPPPAPKTSPMAAAVIPAQAQQRPPQAPPSAPPSQPPPLRQPPPAAQAPGNQTSAFGSTANMPPPQNPAAAFGSTANMGPPQGPAGGFAGPQFGSAPPPPQYQGSQPPGPNNAPSQPPIFGSFPSSPPDPGAPLDMGYEPMAGGGLRQPPAPQAQSISYGAPVLVDVTPRGLVVETAGGYTDTIIPRNSKIPCERTRRFATGRDMQTTVRVRVAQGESTIFPQNTFLGEVELSGLRPAPRGEVVVAVTFEVDADGTLRVRARDVQTGQEARAVLQLIGVADESSVVMMINRFAQQPVVGGPTQ
ncbi:MAG: Hsp70 family protein [Deltaproteobacteria bacterium]|nr:Hsp70 family protein [Deltaproteobacteria bacterium]